MIITIATHTIAPHTHTTYHSNCNRTKVVEWIRAAGVQLYVTLTRQQEEEDMVIGRSFVSFQVTLIRLAIYLIERRREEDSK